MLFYVVGWYFFHFPKDFLLNNDFRIILNINKNLKAVQFKDVACVQVNSEIGEYTNTEK